MLEKHDGDRQGSGDLYITIGPLTFYILDCYICVYLLQATLILLGSLICTESHM